MRRHRRHVVWFGALVGAVAIAMFLGAAEQGVADTVGPTCNTGKPICVAIDDQLQASRSPGGSDHYMTDSVTVSNGGSNSNFVNIVVTMTWADDGAATTSEYRPAFSDPDCPLTGAGTISCAAPKSLAPGESVSFGPLVFRTATSALATGTRLTVTASMKEQSKPPKGGVPPNDATVTEGNTTPYEVNPDLDISEGGGGITATLATSQTGQQFSKLPVSAGAPRGLFEVLEQNYGGTITCPTGLECFAQHVTTVAVGLSPVNLQVTYSGPITVNENSLVVVHTRTNGTVVTIDQACSGTIFSGEPPADEIPCRRVEIDHQNDIIEVDAWDLTNGGWDFG
jgi:hypothetical protein